MNNNFPPKVLPEPDLKALLTLNRLGIELRRKAVELFQEGRYPQEVLSLIEGVSSGACKGFDPEKELSLCWQKGISLLTILDPAYPAALKEISDPPLLLYMKGAITESDLNAIAIVGTRHPSFYGRVQAKRFSGELAEKGLTVVSGLARGIDQVAHESALDVPYGRTIAVLGSGLDVIYPKENEKLYQRILEQGAVLSEYAVGTPPLAENFPRRNRILSGLSRGVFVVEAHSRSGSLITAHQALDQGREVFALPGPVDQLTSRGTHQLLKEGAALVEDPMEILESLVVHLKYADCSEAAGTPPLCTQKEHPVKPFMTEKKEAPLFIIDDEAVAVEEALREEGPLGQDEILEFTGLEPSRLPSLLLTLELNGRIQKGSDGRYKPR